MFTKQKLPSQHLAFHWALLPLESPDTRNQTIPIELPLYVSTIHLLPPSLSNFLGEYPCLSIINCLPIFPSVPLLDSWSYLSYISYKHNLGLSKEPQSKCWSSDEIRKCKFSPNPPDRITDIVSERESSLQGAPIPIQTSPQLEEHTYTEHIVGSLYLLAKPVHLLT